MFIITYFVIYKLKIIIINLKKIIFNDWKIIYWVGYQNTKGVLYINYKFWASKDKRYVAS
jgi:hypothetical protein